MGKLAKIFLIISILLTLSGIGAAYYFYNFHVFKTIHFCIAKNSTDTKVTCATNDECLDKIFQNADEIRASIEKAPGVIKEKLDEAYDLAIICEETCKYREIYGAGFTDDENYVPCAEGDTEIVQEIKGKEAIAFLGAAKDKIF